MFPEKQKLKDKNFAFALRKIYESGFPPSPNFDKVTVCFDKLNNTDLFLQILGVWGLYSKHIY